MCLLFSFSRWNSTQTFPNVWNWEPATDLLVWAMVKAAALPRYHRKKCHSDADVISMVGLLPQSSKTNNLKHNSKDLQFLGAGFVFSSPTYRCMDLLFCCCRSGHGAFLWRFLMFSKRWELPVRKSFCGFLLLFLGRRLNKEANPGIFQTFLQDFQPPKKMTPCPLKDSLFDYPITWIPSKPIWSQ